MAEHKQAVVVGALDVIGRYIVARLLRAGDWSVVGLSHRTAEAAPRYCHIAVDLLDGEDTAAKLAGLRAAMHGHASRPRLTLTFGTFFLA
jgi:NAD(P)-dependent dehydrogenase (short-subunit alcohol dehydrogenase family)